VREALEFSAALRLQRTQQPRGGGSSGSNSGSSASRPAQLAAAVERALRLVELLPLAGRLVGRPGACGGGRRSRRTLQQLPGCAHHVRTQ
jgi:hypothetical protein